MTRVATRAMTDADLAAAGRLLAERHRHHRTHQPLLPADYEQPLAAEAEVVEAWKAAGASGAVATRGDEVVGFLVGAPRSSPLWGPNVWVEAAGHAVVEAEVLRDLYAAAAPRWVEQGWTAHYALVPAHDADLLVAWSKLGFGRQHAHAVRALPRRRPEHDSPVHVRPARRDDVPVLAELALELPRHQAKAPTFSAGDVPTLEETTAEWEEELEEPGFASFVAEHGSAVVGCAVGCPVEKSNSHAGVARPPNAGLLAFAAVQPAARGLGVGRALGEAVLGWAADQGYDAVVTDWRTTNLLSSRAWPALGFEETFLRLHRLLGY